jgi:hypothetical protein
MLPAAGVTPAAQIGMNLFPIGNRCRFRRHALENVRWLCDADERTTPAEMKRRFTVVRLRFNAALTQFDPFSEAITHRGEHDTGVCLAGLVVLGTTRLILLGAYFESRRSPAAWRGPWRRDQAPAHQNDHAMRSAWPSIVRQLEWTHAAI